jgi:hypothetical protein
MLFKPTHENRLDRLEDKLRLAHAVTPDLISSIIVDTCTRLPNRADMATRIDQLIAADAWCDAAVALIELELPAWVLRRLGYEDGQWHCSLSKEPRLPYGYDEIAEASHEILPLAILLAFLQARRTGTAGATSLTGVPRAALGYTVCCDNFA